MRKLDRSWFKEQLSFYRDYQHGVLLVKECNEKIVRPVILTFLSHYLPGYKSGGPVRTIANMVESLGDEFEFWIVTSDRDMLDSQSYADVCLDEWNRVGKAWVFYATPLQRSLRKWKDLIRDTPHDLLYLNSLFGPAYTLLPLFARALSGNSNSPLLIAPRGELSPGALAIKRWKKAPFLALAKTLGWYRKVLWHASTEDEAEMIYKKFGNAAQCVVARNLPAAIIQYVPTDNFSAQNRPLRVVFLSRISKMKNLDYALCVLKNCPTQVQLDIWGTMEDMDYWDECLSLIADLPTHIEVNYRGIANHSKVSEIMTRYDLFFLPTRGENYGHVIAEALSAGTPVLLSDQTPWRDLSAKGVGWDLPLDNNEGAFVEAIQLAAEKRVVEGASWRKHVYEYAVKRLHDPELIEANRRMFYQAMALGRPL